MTPTDAEKMRSSFLAWIRDDGYLVPDAVTPIEWDDEGLPVYYTISDGVRHYLDGEWHAWQAAHARLPLPTCATGAKGGEDEGVCCHESMTGLGHPRLWSCDGCGQITVEVDDPAGPCSDGTRRWRREVIGRVDVKAARRFGPPMPTPTPSRPATATGDVERAAKRALVDTLEDFGMVLLGDLLVESDFDPTTQESRFVLTEVGGERSFTEAGDAIDALLAAERAASGDNTKGGA